MKKQYFLLAITMLFIATNVLSGQTKKDNKKPAAKQCAIQEPIKEDIAAQLAKFKQVKMPFNTAGLSAKERQMVLKLVDAAQNLESIYWRQSDPKALDLYRRLERCAGHQEQSLRRFLMINGSRYDLLEENKPFVGNDPFYPGRALYPAGITRDEIEAYVAKHPEKKAEIYSPYTVVKRQGDDLLTDDYYKSDLAWVDLEDPKFDIIFAPYETYLDDLLGVKTSYGTAIMVRNVDESKKLETYKKYVPDIQDALPIAAEDKPSKKGHRTPMEVMDTPYRTGDLRHGYQAVADNLPNDPRIHQEKGTKKIFFKNFMDARVNYVVLPIGKLLMRDDQGKLASMDGYLAAVLMHEISHGLGPNYARMAGGQRDIREAIGPTFSGLEEAKADVVGLFGLNWLIDKGVLPKERAPEYYASYVAGIFRTVRFGVAEAHGRAEMMEFNYLSERGVIIRDSQSGRYAIDFAKIPSAISDLAKELLEIEATGDRKRAEVWFKKYDSMPSELKSALQGVHDVPVDIDPISPFKEKVQ